MYKGTGQSIASIASDNPANQNGTNSKAMCKPENLHVCFLETEGLLLVGGDYTPVIST